MSTDLLFEHFATLATALDGVARLRELILQLAMQGMLETQNPADESVSENFEKIYKLIKKDKKQSAILPPSYPFPLPKGWTFVYLENLGADIPYPVGDGDHGNIKPSQYQNSGIPYIRVADLGWGELSLKNVVCISEEVHNQNLKSELKPDDIIIAKTGATIGKCAIIPKNIEKANTSASVGKITVDQKLVTPKWILNYFLSYQFKQDMWAVSSKTAQPGFGIFNLKKFVVPLPPLQEQYRIIAKVDRLMAICDDLEARQQQERAGCLKLGTASLAGLQNAESPEEFGRQWAQVCDAFDLILDCSENIERLRDTIVTLGCSGKLTEKWRTENQNIESAPHALSKLIKARKQKKFLKSNLKQHDFSDFPQIPDTWMWSTIEEVSERVTVGHVGPMMNEYRSTGVPFLRSQNVRKNYFEEKGLVHISLEFHDVLIKSKIEPGDLVVVRSGNVGVCCVIPDSLTDANCSDLVIVKQPFGFLPKFGAYYVNSIAQTWVNSGKVGMALTHFNTKSVANLPIPLPPPAEQHRIVAKVDSLMALCDALESRLKERAAIQTKFADAVVKNAGTG